MSSLGKRKERESEDVKHGSTLFVSNLPFTATSTDLQTLFSDIAPVRSAFVVLEQGSGVSKGVGYVSFAIKEDAETAFEQISREGLDLDGRKLRIEWAQSKPKEKRESPVKTEAKPKARPIPKASHSHAVNDPNSIRTAVISGIPHAIDSKVLWKKVRKYEGAEKVEWPIQVSDAAGASVAHVLFDTSSHAQEAVNKLHAHVFKGHILSAVLKKRLDNVTKVTSVNQTTKENETPDSSGPSSIPQTKGPIPNRASRLIVRNLPWNISEQDLRSVFLPYGPIHSIHIPTEKAAGEGALRKPRAKGFAFIWMLSKKDAERAMEKCNGISVRAGMAEDMVSDKQKRKKQRREEKKRSRMEEELAEDAEAKSVEVSSTGQERVIAVDWALSKDKWKEEVARLEGDEDVAMDDRSEEDDGGSGSESNSDGGTGTGTGENSVEENEEGAEENIGVHEGDSGDEDDEDDNEANHESPQKPQLPPPETGTTLFIRNVPFDATDDELRVLFRSFGPLRYARITMDPATGRSRGTGFACFWNKEDADKVIDQSELLRSEMTGTAEVTPAKKNPFTLPSLLIPDPSSELAKSLVLHGRTLDVVRAVTRDEAGKLKVEGEKRREKADKRNTYLLREGVILPNTPAAETVPAADLERRTNSFNARRTLLRSNPSLYVSRTRLSVRQIPTFVTERLLKRLAIHAVRSFQVEVKKGERDALTEDELAEAEATAEDAEEAAKGRPTKKKRLDRNTGVKQSKIVRQHERVDPVTGKGRSKGYGFIEMFSHADALRVLRWANNNAEVGSLFEQWWKDELSDLIKSEKSKETKDDARLKRLQEEAHKEEPRKSRGGLIVEFSIENVQVVQRRSARQENPPADQSKTSAGKLALRKLKSREPLKEKEERPAKKRRLSGEGANQSSTKAQPANPIGSLIGRKRKERKTKRSG